MAKQQKQKMEDFKNDGLSYRKTTPRNLSTNTDNRYRDQIDQLDRESDQAYKRAHAAERATYNKRKRWYSESDAKYLANLESYKHYRDAADTRISNFLTAEDLKRKENSYNRRKKK